MFIHSNALDIQVHYCKLDFCFYKPEDKIMVCGNHQQHVTDDVHIAKPRTSYFFY